MSCQDVCVWMEADGYSNEFYREETRRAAKPHRCCECQRVIEKGESYATGKTEGDFFEARTCAPCDEIRRVFCCEGWVFGELWEAIEDQLFSTWDAMKAIDCLAKLTTEAAVNHMRAKYADYCEARGG